MGVGKWKIQPKKKKAAVKKSPITRKKKSK
jgi:hypothetical protein